MALHPIFAQVLTSHARVTELVTQRPAEPAKTETIWYRGWEVGFDDEAAKWTKEGWRAARGGWDLDCVHTSAATFEALLDDIDEHEAEAPRILPNVVAVLLAVLPIIAIVVVF